MCMIKCERCFGEEWFNDFFISALDDFCVLLWFPLQSRSVCRKTSEIPSEYMENDLFSDQIFWKRICQNFCWILTNLEDFLTKCRLIRKTFFADILKYFQTFGR